MKNVHENKMVKRLNTTLPDPLALYVGEMTGSGALYETPSEFIRDLVRRHMERTYEQERREIHTLLNHSLNENNYADWTAADLDDARRAASE
ncbi:MAG: type II toxin-antitoxin system ParD family antitoxin [Paracoccus sp. (in: a-proteobacteria)]